VDGRRRRRPRPREQGQGRELSSTPAQPPVVTPEELVELLGLDAEEAARVAQLVQITIEAYLWPATIPDPVPPPIHAVGLALSARFAGATLTKAGQVQSESVGSYSYRLFSPLTFDNVVMLLGDLAGALDPWAPRHQEAYTLNTAPPIAPAGWPIGWWQADLDNLVKTADEAAIAAAGGPPP
jgi:hypothetical protein